jgi:hypothetical protein
MILDLELAVLQVVRVPLLADSQWSEGQKFPVSARGLQVGASGTES